MSTGSSHMMDVTAVRYAVPARGNVLRFFVVVNLSSPSASAPASAAYDGIWILGVLKLDGSCTRIWHASGLSRSPDAVAERCYADSGRRGEGRRC